MPYIVLMYSFIETRLFTRLMRECLTDHEYSELQEILIANPEAGDVIPGSGGIRKLRWRSLGRGKRSGFRVVYFVKKASRVFWMLTMYPKNARDNIPANILRQIRKEIEDEQG